MTITFDSSTVTWGGAAGDIVNASTSAYQGTGYTSAWIAKDGEISLYYSLSGSTTSYPVYGYQINGQGQLELIASSIIV